MPALLLFAISFPQEHTHDIVPANIYLKLGQPFFTYTSLTPLEVLRAAQTMENRLPALQRICSGQKLLVLTPNYVLCMTTSLSTNRNMSDSALNCITKYVKQYIPQLLFVDFLAHLKTVNYQCQLKRSSVLTETQNNGCTIVFTWCNQLHYQLAKS